MRPVSLQLYTLRHAIDEDLPGTLSRVAGMGYHLVEPYRFVDRPAPLADALAAAGLSAPSAHAAFLDGDRAGIFGAASRLGVSTLIQPSSPTEAWGSADGVRDLAHRINEAAREAADHGLRLGYHNHAFEYAGGVDAPLERFAQALDDEVALEVDTYWVAVGGDDPVALLRRLGARVGFLHVKDGPVSADTKDQLPVGEGAMPVAEILDVAPTALAVVELDDYRGDMFEAVATSLANLKGMLA